MNSFRNELIENRFAANISEWSHIAPFKRLLLRLPLKVSSSGYVGGKLTSGSASVVDVLLSSLMPYLFNHRDAANTEGVQRSLKLGHYQILSKSSGLLNQAHGLHPEYQPNVNEIEN